ncbi:hypothetical protein [Acinetobacter silvestris]|uniref:Uncharacterized protein n=1 Tax=Acinetobacter silvestris TaxID=1977882 RepID=A0A1Y3CJ11_9GAMM|nr:hypothetical protein [Acinetobacter silvestris]OTG67099.1 hypothetical protein B9T28_00145 [Acinetobacter silvestris]
MKKTIVTSLLMSLMIATVDAKSITTTVMDDAAGRVNFQDVAVDCVGYCEIVVSDAADVVSSSDYSKGIKPLNEKYALEAGDVWQFIYSNANARFLESTMTVNDGIQYVGAWIKRIDQKKRQQHINYYQVLCKDQSFTLLEQFQSKDDQNYTIVKNVDHYRQAQTFNNAGEELPVFTKLCQSRDDFAKAWQ